MKSFEKADLKKLYKAPKTSSGEENGQLTIIGGSSLFHGAPLLSLRATSRIVDMVFFSSPEKTMEEVAAYIKADLSSFIWVPWDEIESYVSKSDAVLIGPGMMRFHSEEEEKVLDKNNEAYKFTKEITETLLKKFPEKKWVIDAGSLQTVDPKVIPVNAILTPNSHEYAILFGDRKPEDVVKEYKCTLVLKGPTGYVYSADEAVQIEGGNAGLTKGGIGDVQAGLTAALLTKNDPFLAASAAAFVVKATGDSLYKSVGTSYNADDLADHIPAVLATL